MKILAMCNIDNEIILDKTYECLEDSEKGYLVLNELNITKIYDKLLFGILPLEVEKPTSIK